MVKLLKSGLRRVNLFKQTVLFWRLNDLVTSIWIIYQNMVNRVTAAVYTSASTSFAKELRTCLNKGSHFLKADKYYN